MTIIALTYSRHKFSGFNLREMCITGSVHLHKVHVLRHFGLIWWVLGLDLVHFGLIWGVLGLDLDHFGLIWGSWAWIWAISFRFGGPGPGFGPFRTDLGIPGPGFWSIDLFTAWEDAIWIWSINH